MSTPQTKQIVTAAAIAKAVVVFNVYVYQQTKSGSVQYLVVWLRVY